MSNPLIRRFLRQTATWKPRTAADDYDGNTYGTPATIKVRWYDEVKSLMNANEVEVISTAHISCLEHVHAGDLITDPDGRDREVITVRRNLDTRGAFSHHVAYLT